MIKKQILNKKELILTLQEAIHGNDIGRILHRMHVVLFVLEFNSIEEASRIFHDPPRTIQDWIKKITDQGVDGLQEKKRMGRPTRLSVTQKEILRNVLSLSPRDIDERYQQTNWEGKLLSDYIGKQWNITLEARQCQRLLHKLGYTLQRPRPGTIGNQEEQEAFKKKTKSLQKAIKKNSDISIWSEDEVTFYQGLTITRRWAKKGHQPTIASPCGKAKIGFFGMVNLTNGHLVTQEAVTFNQGTFQHFLEKALLETKGKLIIILDNAKWHKSKQIQAFFLDHLDRLEPLYLPPYSPQCNPVERVWRLTRKLVTHNRYFETYYSLVRSLYDQLIVWGKPNRMLHRLCANI